MLVLIQSDFTCFHIPYPLAYRIQVLEIRVHIKTQEIW